MSKFGRRNFEKTLFQCFKKAKIAKNGGKKEFMVKIEAVYSEKIFIEKTKNLTTKINFKIQFYIFFITWYKK